MFAPSGISWERMHHIIRNEFRARMFNPSRMNKQSPAGRNGRAGDLSPATR
ncbi:MAG: hypothetical protein R3220_01675 [Balneolaceae bacterium]|nr:hypothetical protein [Balneolaceae bacterium]